MHPIANAPIIRSFVAARTTAGSLLLSCRKLRCATMLSTSIMHAADYRNQWLASDAVVQPLHPVRVIALLDYTLGADLLQSGAMIQRFSVSPAAGTVADPGIAARFAVLFDFTLVQLPLAPDVSEQSSAAELWAHLLGRSDKYTWDSLPPCFKEADSAFLQAAECAKLDSYAGPGQCDIARDLLAERTHRSINKRMLEHVTASEARATTAEARAAAAEAHVAAAEAHATAAAEARVAAAEARATAAEARTASETEARRAAEARTASETEARRAAEACAAAAEETMAGLENENAALRSAISPGLVAVAPA